jgi:hypothetical protein
MCSSSLSSTSGRGSSSPSSGRHGRSLHCNIINRLASLLRLGMGGPRMPLLPPDFGFVPVAATPVRILAWWQRQLQRRRVLVSMATDSKLFIRSSLHSAFFHILISLIVSFAIIRPFHSNRPEKIGLHYIYGLTRIRPVNSAYFNKCCVVSSYQLLSFSSEWSL